MKELNLKEEFEREQQEIIEAMDIDELGELIDTFYEVKLRRDDLKKKLEQIQIPYDLAMDELILYMKSHRCKGYNREGVGLGTPGKEIMPKIKDAKKFFELLEELGEDGIIKPTIHPQTLKAWVNGSEDGGIPPAWQRFDDLSFDKLNETVDLTFQKNSIRIRKG